MNKHYKNKNGGYIALMATIIIALVLLVMTVEEGLTGWYARYAVLGTEAKEQATALAEGCGDQALALLITDLTYQGNTDTITPAGDCHTYPITFNSPSAGMVDIKTQAVVRQAYANLELSTNLNSVHLGNIPSAPTYGTLIIQTLVSNNQSGTQYQPSDFLMHVAGVSPSKTSFAGSATGVVVTVSPGAYSITEDTVPGYAPTPASCSGTITGGQIKSCTISNSPISTTLTVVANVTNDNGMGSAQPTDVPLFIDGTPAILGHAYTVAPGSHTVSATNPDTVHYFASPPWGYQCASDGSVNINLGDNKICIVTFNDIPPPAPLCADTVMMLDRTGSMSSTDLTNEKTAANALVSLYASVPPPNPPPSLGVGSFGAYPNASLPAGAASVPANGVLTTVYNTLTNLINQMLGGNSSVGTNLAAAIQAGSSELTTHGSPSKQKVLILVSDGDPNEPTSGSSASTGFFSPSANAQNASGELWSNPTDAYAQGGNQANDPVSENDHHRFYNFNLPAIPAGATINGIEVAADAWATTTSLATAPASASGAPSAAMASPNNQWTNGSNAFTSNNVYATDAVNGHNLGLSTFGFNLPANATITGVQVTTEAKVSGGGVAGPTATLFPNGQGNYTSWNGDESDVDETGTVSCASGDRIDSNNNGNRESVNIDISSIPNGSTITNVQIFAWDLSAGATGGQYQTFLRVSGTNTDSGTTLTTLSQSTCTQRSQTIATNIAKSSSTDLEVGVLKVGNTEARIGALRAIVTYIPAPTGSVAISLSSNNGGAWTATKTVSLGGTESVTAPSGNSATDLWGRVWAPANFGNGNFALRVTNTSTSGTTVSLDQVNITVNYTTPIPAPVSCQLGMDLSWNAGSSWTSEKTQTLTSTSATYTFGSPTDDWSGHTWGISDFTNANFRVRVHAIDPGSSCDNASVDRLDWLRTQVHYTVPMSPTEAALSAADAAKLSGINLFTIYFGSGNPSLLAQLASGTVAVAGHQPGSYNDPSGVVTGNTGLVSPASQASDTGGTGNGFEGNPTGVFANGGTVATNVSGLGDRHRFWGYNFSTPPNATIVGIQVRTDWWTNSTNGTNSINVELSWDGGSTWTTAKTQGTESTSDSNNKTVGSSSDTWGRVWSSSDLSSTNFRVRVTTNCSGSGSSCSSRTFSLDWVPVTVYYSVNYENGDGDNFFIAPTSPDMKGIFEFIGNQVCPAVNNSSPVAAPTTGTLYVITRVVNNNNGTNVPGDFTAKVTGGNASPGTPFPGLDTPGQSVTLDKDASYSVTQPTAPSGYTQSMTDSCSSATSSTLPAGESRVCIITNDDIPPPPPPPNLTVTPGSWQEVPNTGP